ncbi:MAG: sugar phosphate isomerase/epimerase [PVC group bacterium]|nr:sugar phosphate isomerase/epimerase [PVC group bacterium]
MLNLSTSWNASSHKSGYTIIEEIKKAGFTAVELSFHISQITLKEILELKEKEDIRINSVHNFCPVPDEYKNIKFTPDYFSLASDDEKQRQKAVKLTLQSIHTTKKTGARALVIHAGRVEMEQKTKELIKLYNKDGKDTEEYIQLIEQIKTERKNKAGKHFKAIIHSLETLLIEADKIDIDLCLENRYYYREIPSLEEFDRIFDHFSNHKHLFYWHDVGHAQVADNLGLASHAEFLKRYGDKMYGIHLHDVTGAKDHQAPGQGKYDFNLLKPYLKKDDIIKVIEVHQPTSTKQLISGASYLKNIGIV